MSRLTMILEKRPEASAEAAYADLERSASFGSPGMCPIDMLTSVLNFMHSQTCGKCVPCRVGLKQLEHLLNTVVDGEANKQTLEDIRNLATTVFNSADCALGWEAARLVLKSLDGFEEDFLLHIRDNRCVSSSFNPVPCRTLCPAHVDIPGYVSLVRAGRYKDAIRLIRKDNPFPHVCGLICENPCEEGCRRGVVDFPLNIRAIKRYAYEKAGDVPAPTPSEPTGKKVAIIGAGPSGLTAAYFLRLMGHDVTVFEKRKKAGGMLRYGIPAYRLPREILDKEIETILSTGIKLHTEVDIGNAESLAQLDEKYDAVYVAIGAQTDKKLRIDGADADGITSAVDMLKAIGDDDYPDFTGKKVSVIGGGNVAMDVARTSLRLGADEVNILYRRRKQDMTALEAEVEGAIAEGCVLYELNAPLEIEKDANNHVSAVRVQPQITGEIRNGRPTPTATSEEPIHIPTDVLIIAIGQSIDSQPFSDYGIVVDHDKLVASEGLQIRSKEGFFAGGDCVTGPITVIQAIAAGKTAAANIDDYLGFHHEIVTDIEIPEPKMPDRTPCGRINVRETNPLKRTQNFDCCELTFTDEEASQESSKCLRCDHYGYGVLKEGRINKW